MASKDGGGDDRERTEIDQLQHNVAENETESRSKSNELPVSFRTR